MAVFFSFSRGVRNGKKISTRLQKLLGLPIDYWITFGLPGEFQDYEWITKIIGRFFGLPGITSWITWILLNSSKITGLSQYYLLDYWITKEFLRQRLQARCGPLAFSCLCLPVSKVTE
uniref:Uncharacterized protein n=1 Tax=Amphimedon queenslandica TaxID=400682 RepID=A0A1X7TVY5_AMPQE